MAGRGGLEGAHRRRRRALAHLRLPPSPPSASKSVPDFGLPPELALELLKAANYLDA